MPAQRYFLEQTLQKGDEIHLLDEEWNHLVKVMRSEVGQRIEVINGMNTLAKAEIVSIEKKKATLKVVELQISPKPSFRLILCQAFPKLPKLDFIVEKGTELGMTDLWLFPGEWSEKREANDHQLKRMRALCIAAIKQCGRLDLPQIELKPPLQQWEKKDLPFQGFYGDLKATQTLFQHSIEQGALFFVGPESGFSPKENHILMDLGVIGVKLHSHILRTETASLVALAQISSIMSL